MNENAPPLILIHGAWHGPWCWSPVAPLLREAGREVHTPCLPGHDNTQSPGTRISLRHYLQSLTSFITTFDRPVILVGHSMAGMIISALGEALPERIDRLVFVNAYLPCDGDSVFSLMGTLEDSDIPSIAGQMRLSEDRLTYTLPPDVLSSWFYNDCSAERQGEALRQYCPQPSLPLAARVRLGDSFSALPRTCLFSNQDRIIPPVLQQQMRRRQSCDEWLQLDSDHSPFFSAPATLASILAAQ